MYKRHWITLGLVLALSAPGVAATKSGEKALASRIANTIRDSGELTNFRIGVRHEDGKAVLLGEVSDRSQAEAAMRIARSVPGVTSVENQLEYTQANPLRVEASEPTLDATPGEDSGMLLALKAEEPPIVGGKPSKVPQAPKAPRPIAANKLKKAAMTPRLDRVAGRPPREMPPAPHRVARANTLPRPVAYSSQGPRPAVGMRPPVQPVGYGGAGARPAGFNPGGGGATGVGYTSPSMPGYAWPSYAAPQNYSALTYPRQYSPTAWPYIGPFYPYPQVPLGWRKVALEWDDGWWFLDFSHHQAH